MAILGIDIGGTKTIVGAADRSGTLIAHKRIETPGSLGPEKAIREITRAAREIVERADARVEAVGIGCGGPMDRKAGVLHDVPNLPGWSGLCLTCIFGQEFGAPAYLDNDATAAAIGEAMFGAGRGIEDFVYFTVSTGIGGGIIIGGRPYRGHGDNAGEFGHMKIIPEGPPCPCGDRGCLEALASGTSIARIARERMRAGTQTILREWTAEVVDVTAEMVSLAAAQGDEFCQSIWREATYHLGLGIANVVNAFNPRLVILGGGVTRAGDLLFEPVRAVVRERAMGPLADEVEVVPAANGDLVGLMGAVALAIEGCGS